MRLRLDAEASVWLNSDDRGCNGTLKWPQPPSLILEVETLRSLTETNSEFTPEKKPSQKETIVFQPLFFMCYVCFREGTKIYFLQLMERSPANQ